MKITPLKFEDYEAILALWKRAGLPFNPKGRDSKEEVEKQLQGNADLFLGAYEGQQLIGIIVGSDDGRKGWINRLAVVPEHRRGGVASALIDACEKALRLRGRKIICTLIEDWNSESLLLFWKAGYVQHEDIFYLSKRDNDEV